MLLGWLLRFKLKCIVPLLPNFNRLYPELTVDLWLTDAVVDLLTERINVAVRLGLLADSSLIMISSAIALQQCAIAGMGVALLPNWLIEDDLQTGTLIDVFPEYDVTATDFSTAA